MVNGTVIVQVYIYFPFYQFVYSNTAFSKIVVIVSFDILANKLTILKNETVPAPKAKDYPSVLPTMIGGFRTVDQPLNNR